MSILEDLWYGNICPMENSYDETKDYKELLDIYNRNREKLVPTMNDEQKETLEKMHDVWLEMMQHAESGAFITGFKLAVQIMVASVHKDNSTAQ